MPSSGVGSEAMSHQSLDENIAEAIDEVMEDKRNHWAVS